MRVLERKRWTQRSQKALRATQKPQKGPSLARSSQGHRVGGAAMTAFREGVWAAPPTSPRRTAAYRGDRPAADGPGVQRPGPFCAFCGLL